MDKKKKKFQVAVLEQEAILGFKELHFWSCPPQNDQHYIFNDIEIPTRMSKEKLRDWHEDAIQIMNQHGFIAGAMKSLNVYLDKTFKNDLHYFPYDALPYMLEEDDFMDGVKTKKLLKTKYIKYLKEMNHGDLSQKSNIYENLYTVFLKNPENEKKTTAKVGGGKKRKSVKNKKNSNMNNVSISSNSNNSNIIPANTRSSGSRILTNTSSSSSSFNNTIPGSSNNSNQIYDEINILDNSRDKNQLFRGNDSFLEYCEINNLKFNSIEAFKSSSKELCNLVLAAQRRQYSA